MDKPSSIVLVSPTVPAWREISCVRQAGRIAAVPSIENGGDAMTCDVRTLDEFYRQGVWMLGLTWNNSNPLGDGALGRDHSGLTDLGRAVLMSRVRPCLVLAALLAVSPSAWAHGDLRWTTLSPADIQRLTASSAAFEYAPFLPARLRAARLVQQSDDHLRFDADGDGICEGQADLVGIGAPQWYAVVGRRSREVKTRLFVLLVDVDDNGSPDLRVEMEAPRAFYWVVAYQYEDAALRPDSSEAIARWRSRLAQDMVRTYYEAQYLFHHGPGVRRRLPGGSAVSVEAAAVSTRAEVTP
jgi:hypothetical protein